MRWSVLLVAACILLAGCAAPFSGPAEETPEREDSGDRTESTPVVHEDRPDPEADRLGWEADYWHDDPVPVNATDGLNESERDAVIARAMARVEVVRNMEFEEPVDVSVVSRENYTEEFGDDETGAALRTFDNAKFEALYLIGTDEDSIETQDENRNQTVAGFYSPSREAIVVVSDSETPNLDGERTLAHELVHALQDQQFNLSTADTPQTRDAYNGRNGLVEGDARVVELEYMDRCGQNWSCLPGEETAVGGDDDEQSIHLGVYILSYFPYSDGVGFVSHLREGDDWSRVNAAFDDPPSSSSEVVVPERYGSFEPTDVELRDRTRNGWERVRPGDRPDHAVLGQSALASMFAYTLYDEYNASAVVEPDEFLNTDVAGVNRTDPFNYDLGGTPGWQGDRLHVYERDDQRSYVWRLAWRSSADAERFAAEYRELLRHWGGEETGDGVWVVADESPFTGAVSLDVDGETVTVVRAPNEDALGEVYRGAG